LLLLLSLGFVLSGRFVIMDGLLTWFMTVCLLAMFLAVRGPRVRWTWWLVAAVACGLGVLTKGLVAIVLTVPPLAALVWLDRTVARVRLRHGLALLAIVLAINAPWFVLIAERQAEFVSNFLWKHHVVRFVSAFNHKAPFWYYIPVLLIGMFPSSLLLGPTLDFLVGRREMVRRLRTPELGAIALACVWILAFFSLSSCKLPTYILPAAPLLCLLQGHMFHHLLGGRYARAFWARLAQRLPAHALHLAVLIGAGLAVADLVLEPDRGLGRALNLLMIGGALAFLAYRAVRWRSWPMRRMNWVAAAGVSLLVMGFAFQKFVPEFARYRSISASAAQLGRAPDGTVLPVVYYEWQCDGCAFEMPADQVRRFRTGDLAHLQQFVLAHPRTVLVADPPHVALLQDTLGARISLAPSRGARGRLYLLSTAPAPASLVSARPPTHSPR
jgi:4-amino-4-deoxy-L-arabinose transferase-like glycosyltransferase